MFQRNPQIGEATNPEPRIGRAPLYSINPSEYVVNDG